MAAALPPSPRGGWSGSLRDLREGERLGALSPPESCVAEGEVGRGGSKQVREQPASSCGRLAPRAGEGGPGAGGGGRLFGARRPGPATLIALPAAAPPASQVSGDPPRPLLGFHPITAERRAGTRRAGHSRRVVSVSELSLRRTVHGHPRQKPPSPGVSGALFPVNDVVYPLLALLRAFPQLIKRTPA